MIFVDTSAWFAAYVPNDKNHRAARGFIDGVENQRLLTTDYVVAESLTLFKARGEYARALRFGEDILGSRVIRLEWVQRPDFEQAWTIFQSFRDQDWSFVDCVSRVMMTRLDIGKAFTFDRHFRQFGTVTVVP